MSRYEVYLVTEACIVVEVEADSPEQAEDYAIEKAGYPSTPFGVDYDLGGDWEVDSIEKVEEDPVDCDHEDTCNC